MSESNPLPAARSSLPLRLALGFVYLHFGILKLFPDLSPAEMIAGQTILRLSWGWLDPHRAVLVLAAFECAIGLAFLFGIGRRWLPLVFFLHMAGTTVPLFVLPELVFKFAPFAPTLEGQYIMKNLVFVTAAWVVLVPETRLGELRESLVARARRFAAPRDAGSEVRGGAAAQATRSEI